MKLLLTLFLFTALLMPILAMGAIDPIDLNLEYPSFKVGNQTFDLNETQDLNAIVAWFYYLIIGISGLAAFVMLIWGGIQWLSSAGSPGQITDAKDRIQKALLGLLLVLSSFLVLQIINPELTILRSPELTQADIQARSGGSCPLPTNQGECNSILLQKDGWNDASLASDASRVCQKESIGGDTRALNDSCLRGSTCDFSGGLFQFRAMDWCLDKGITIVPGSIEYTASNVQLCTCVIYDTQELNSCLAKRGVGNIRVSEDSSGNKVARIITDGSPTLQRQLAKTLWYNVKGWSAWTCTARDCGLVSGPTCSW